MTRNGRKTTQINIYVIRRVRRNQCNSVILLTITLQTPSSSCHWRQNQKKTTTFHLIIVNHLIKIIVKKTKKMVFIFYIQTNSRGTAEFRLRWRILYDIDVIIEIDIGGPSPTSNIWKIQIPRRFLLNGINLSHYNHISYYIIFFLFRKIPVPRNWNDILYTLENLMYCSISGEQFSELESGIIIGKLFI